MGQLPNYVYGNGHVNVYQRVEVDLTRRRPQIQYVTRSANIQEKDNMGRSVLHWASLCCSVKLMGDWVP